MTKDNIFREARKLVDILNTHGNCIVPSIHEDKSDTYALERLRWIVAKAYSEHGLTVEDIEIGIEELQ